MGFLSLFTRKLHPEPSAGWLPLTVLYATDRDGLSAEDGFALRDIIASKSNAFARSFSEALIEFALGRPIGFRDEPLIDDMITQASKKDFAMREFIHALVNSREFGAK